MRSRDGTSSAESRTRDRGDRSTLVYRDIRSSDSSPNKWRVDEIRIDIVPLMDCLERRDVDCSIIYRHVINTRKQRNGPFIFTIVGNTVCRERFKIGYVYHSLKIYTYSLHVLYKLTSMHASKQARLQACKQTSKQADTQSDKQACRQALRQARRYVGKQQTCKHTSTQAGKLTSKQTCKHAGRQTCRQACMQASK